MLNAAHAYLVEQADAQDVAAVPAYEVAGVPQKDIEKMSRRDALEKWLNAPWGVSAAREQAVVDYLTS